MSKSIYVLISINLIIAHIKCDYVVSSERELLVEQLDVTRSEIDITRQIEYRLPQNVNPIEYDVYIDLYFDDIERPFSYDGRVEIVIQAVEQNVSQIVLHSNVDQINTITLRTYTGAPHSLNLMEPFIIEYQYHFLKVNLAQNLEVGVNYTLIVEYSSTMNEGPMKRGIWRGWYVDADGVERIYATTHFQPYNARQAFPCWDEPLFKAVFTLHLTRLVVYNGRFSNTGIATINLFGNGRVTDNFFPTPKMSSYLVTFLVSETFTVIGENATLSPPVRVIGRSNAVGLADKVLQWAVGMTQFFDEYFDIPYSSMHPYLFNDHVSSPDWASAGTENWGMVSYRELYMILDPQETLMSVEHYAATLISHELAHKWFGNLITCFWWSNTWINEGFASYFGYIATNEVFPEYEHNDHFNSRYLQNSLSADSGVSSPALNHEVNTPSQVTGHFGTVSYSKGAAFLRMVEDIISPETFKKALRYFLLDNAFEPTDQYDLYNAFARAISEDQSLSQYPNFNFTDFYRIWVNEPGYPLLTVDINHSTGEMALRQERFFLSPSATPSDQIYSIPVTYATKSSPVFDELKPVYMMDSQQIVLTRSSQEEWVIFNNLQHGHYRVNYDDNSWKLIAEALLNDPESINYLNRAQIVDDVFALMRSERMNFSFGFEILQFLRYETNYHVLDAAITGYTWLRSRLRQIADKLAEFDNFVLSNLENVIEQVGFEPVNGETPTDVMKRQAILHFACNLGHEKCVQESRARYVAMRDQSTWVNVGIRRNVYISGIREGGQQDFNYLVNRYQQSNYANDQLEMLRGLGSTKVPALITQYLELTLTNMVRSHDKATAFNYALLGNPENAYTVLQFVKNNINAMRIAYIEDSPANPVQSCLTNLASYLDEAGLVEYEEWLRSSESSSAQYSSTLSAITSARSNMEWGAANADFILIAVRGSAVKAVTSLFMLLLVLVAMLI